MCRRSGSSASRAPGPRRRPSRSRRPSRRGGGPSAPRGRRLPLPARRSRGACPRSRRTAGRGRGSRRRPRTSSATGSSASSRRMPTAAWPAISFSVDGHAAARGVAQDVDGVAGGREEVRDEAVQSGRVALERRLEPQALAHRHDRDAVHGDRRRSARTTSPGRARRGEITTPGGDDPDARRVDEDAVALAAVHDLRVAGDDRHARASRPRAASTRRSAQRSAIGRPSSRMSPAESASGRAPHIARSFTVPCTASEPMSPPGKKSGWTTNESVVKARRAPPASRIAPSCSSRSAGLSNAGRKSALDQPLRQAAAAAVRHAGSCG